MKGIIGITVAVLIAGCAATQTRLPQQTPSETDEFLFRAKAEAKSGAVNATVELKGPVEIVKEVGSGFARAQWCKEQKAVAVLNGKIGTTFVKDTQTLDKTEERE